MPKRHSIDMTDAWAKENGIRGYDHLDPKRRSQQRNTTGSGRGHYDSKRKPIKRHK